MRRQLFLSWALLLATIPPLTSGCHQTPEQKTDAEMHPNETEAERNERHRREAEAAKQQTAAMARFRKALAVIRTVKVGDAYNDFYRKADEARLSLERVTNTADGRVERYAFMDNSTAFVTVVVKADHLTEIRMEGVGR
jgi:hypothetical protein